MIYNRTPENSAVMIENAINMLYSINEKLDKYSQETNKKKKDYDFRKQINWK